MTTQRVSIADIVELKMGVKRLEEQTERIINALYPDGDEGALQKLASLQGKVKMIFTIGGALYGLGVIVFSVTIAKMIELLARLLQDVH